MFLENKPITLLCILQFLQEPLTSQFNKKELAHMENFLQAVFSSSSVDASLANDAGMVLKLFEADRSSVRCVRAAMTALSKLQTGTATLVRFRNLCYIIFCYVFVLSIFVCGITLGTWN